MKKTLLVIHSLAFVAGLAGIASVVPFGVHEIAQGGGLSVSELAGSGGGGGNATQFGTYVTQSIHNGGNGFQAYSGPSQTLPLSPALVLLGAGMAAWGLAGWLIRR